MSISGNIPPDIQKDIYRKSITVGDVFLKEFENIDHKKLFIIAGISNDKMYICSIFINSRIHPLQNKPKLLKLQIPLLKSRNSFLEHDSHANCSYPIKLDTEQIISGIINGSCRVIGRICDEDLRFIQHALIHSELLTTEEIELYFNAESDL
ncbi:MAG: hypothetical protein LBH82_07060 [Bacteroidales bacterium]|jgi:hypothetical protein|nr:hypothetical protein [Bacteroidales bacterium]